MASESPLDDPDWFSRQGAAREPAQFLIELRSADGAPPGRARWLAPDEVTTVQVGSTSVTYVGACLADDAFRRRRCASAVDRGRWAGVTDLPGSFLVVVISPYLVAVYGDAVGLRRVFYARLGDVWLVSDRADVLARCTGADLDDRWLALWLVWAPPEVAGSATPWVGVAAVPPGGCLVWRPDQAEPEVDVYWTPPVADMALEDGAPAFAEALTTAVHERLQHAARPSLDLSGGKDTVALAFLADDALRRHGRMPGSGDHILALTLPSISVDNDDVAWARAVAGSLPTFEHLVVPLEACPLPYDDLRVGGAGDEWLVTDHPSIATMHSARRRYLAARLRQQDRGADHLAGYGGDEVVQATPAYVSSLLRRRPLLALHRVRQHSALTGASAWRTLGSALAPGSFPRWLRRAGQDVRSRRLRPRQGGGFGWGTMAPPAPWLTDHALSLAAQALALAGSATETISGEISPELAADVAQHATLARIRAGAATVRLHQQSMSRLGVRMHCPYLDRHVVESSLAVHAHERTDPSVVKPLLDTALAATVPARFRARLTKTHYTEDTARGVWHNRDALRRLVAGARLADRGLVDADLLVRAVGRSRDQRAALLALNDTVSCERWLRAQEEAA